MNVTESRFKNRQIHIEDYQQMVSAEQKEYAEVFDYGKITEKSGIITDCCSSTYLMFLSSDYFRLHLFNLINLINEVKATSSHYINKPVIQ